MNKFKSYSQYLNEKAEVEQVNSDKKPADKKETVKETVASMLEKCYESSKYEAKVWEDDAHDSHTVESYMSENAALIAGLAVGAMREMKKDHSTETFEATCNKMIESYTTKINELKEIGASGDAEDVAESVRRGSFPAFSVDIKTYKVRQWYADDDMEADAICDPVIERGTVSYCYESGHSERSVKGIADTVVKMLKSKKDHDDIEEYVLDQD
jgi:hypothetical protein